MKLNKKRKVFKKSTIFQYFHPKNSQKTRNTRKKHDELLWLSRKTGKTVKSSKATLNLM